MHFHYLAPVFLPIAHTIQNQVFWLSPHKTVFWEAQRALIVSDMHLGKASHFRKAGMAIPMATFRNDLHRLTHDIQYFKPNTLIVVGDMFHSNTNAENNVFQKWRTDFSSLQILLVKGNHDILKLEWYKKCNITVINNEYVLNDFLFIHEPPQKKQAFFYFSGHTHPGVVLNGVGHSTLKLPCFYFTKFGCTLPAFGSFTGLNSINISKTDSVFAIAENQIIKL